MKKVLKIMFMIIVIIAVLIVVWQLSLFVRVKNIEEKTFENFNGDYYYKMTDSSHTVTEFWVSDDYNKVQRMGSIVMWEDKENGFFITRYTGEEADAIIEYIGDDGSDRMFMNMFKSGSIQYMTHWTWDNIKYIIKSMSFDGLLNDIRNLFNELITYPLTCIKSITTEEVNGKECYKIELRDGMNEFETYYIEKETCLIIRGIRKNGITTGDGINIYMRDYEYSFETITEESLNLPSLDNCYVVIQDNM